MNSTELATRLKLHPRAVILTGTLRERTKNSDTGAISGYLPHFAVKGCPPVAFTSNGEPSPSLQDGAAIEADFAESQPVMPTVVGSYGRTLNMIHLIFGSQSNPPNASQMKLLREAGEILRSSQGKTVHLIALPVLSAAQYGIAQGRLYLLGLFGEDGTPLFVHPDAVGHTITTAYPQNQKVRTTQPVAVVATPVQTPAPAVTATATWYESMKQAIASVTDLKGVQLHKKTLAARADQLVKSQGLSPRDALAQAQKEYESIQPGSNPTIKTPAVAAQSAPTPTKRLSQAKV